MHAILISIFITSFQATQQPSPPAPTQPATKDGNLLSGPTVAEVESRPTLVHRAFDGTLEEIDPEIDYAAVSLIQLTDDQKKQCETIHSGRLRTFDDCVRRNYGLILELASLQGQNDGAKALEVLTRAREALGDFIKRGTFLDEMRPHLQPPQIEQVNALLDEYRQARLAELRRSIGESATLRQIGSRARLEGFGRMIRLSIERQTNPGKEAFEEISHDLNLTEDQRAKAMTIFQPLAVKQFQRLDTSADRIEAFRQFREILNAEQKAQFFEIIVKYWRPEREEKPADPSPPPGAAPN